mmetsp:Transcript_49859/g.108007  ORF Transcript_49859/g.108007 Transcript_49859/m.108007 type:complete len:268 (+) Transcript_49859:112-915(+)
MPSQQFVSFCRARTPPCTCAASTQRAVVSEVSKSPIALRKRSNGWSSGCKSDFQQAPAPCSSLRTCRAVAGFWEAHESSKGYLLIRWRGPAVFATARCKLASQKPTYLSAFSSIGLRILLLARYRSVWRHVLTLAVPPWRVLRQGVRSPSLTPLCAAAAAAASLRLNCSDLTSLGTRAQQTLRALVARTSLASASAAMLLDQGICATAGLGFFSTSKFCGPAGFRRSTFSESIANRWLHLHNGKPLCANALEHALMQGWTPHGAFVY